VAFLLSYDSRFAFEIQGNNPRFSYPEHFHAFYRAFYNQQVPVDIVSPTSDLSQYTLVVAPALYIVTEEIGKNLEDFVRGGGVLVVTPRTGVKDEANAVVNQPLPGLLSEVCGIEVEEYVSLPIDLDNEIKFSIADTPTASHSAEVWCDLLKLKGASVLACYTQDYFAGRPAITLNEYGEGKAVYMGTMGKPILFEIITSWLLEKAGIKPLCSVPEGIEVGERWQADRRIIFLLNHSDTTQVIPLEGQYIDLLRESASIEGSLVIPPRGVFVLLES
jgi:beta-galactosidase